MFGLSGFEVAIILLFAFLIFGPDKLPQIARTIGRGIRQFRTAQEQMNKVIKAEVYDPLKDLEPLANPFSGFSLDLENLGKPTQEKDTKKVAGTSDNKETDNDKDGAAQEAKVLSSEEVNRALAQDAEKAKKKAIRDAAKKAAGSAESESFADRRARLEREHAQAKTQAAKADKTTDTRGEDELGN